MTISGNALSNKATGRLAGLVYLVVVLTGLFSLSYAPSQLIARDDPSTTLENIRRAETLFRFWIAAGLAANVFWLILPVMLYRLFEPHGRIAAILMIAFVLPGVAIGFIGIQEKMAILPLIGGNAPDAAAAQVMQYLTAYNTGLSVASIFWGLWLLPLGYLVFTSRLLPRLLGILLILGCAGYLTNFFGSLHLPGYRETAIPWIAVLPSGMGEIGTCLWLLIMGANVPRQREQANAARTGGSP